MRCSWTTLRALALRARSASRRASTASSLTRSAAINPAPRMWCSGTSCKSSRWRPRSLIGRVQRLSCSVPTLRHSQSRCCRGRRRRPRVRRPRARPPTPQRSSSHPSCPRIQASRPSTSLAATMTQRHSTVASASTPLPTSGNRCHQCGRQGRLLLQLRSWAASSSAAGTTAGKRSTTSRLTTQERRSGRTCAPCFEVDQLPELPSSMECSTSVAAGAESRRWHQLSATSPSAPGKGSSR
mmetsp:Transcript_90795/g.241280  ORF Transcript_90795/g.241280 Transcript_90795/m.241280 type:complete len:240 (+) Transcript_90795:122-841(+)